MIALAAKKHMTRELTVLFVSAVLFVFSTVNTTSRAWATGPGNDELRTATLEQPSVLHAILFYSPSCPHCRKIITESLPEVFKEFGPSLNIVLINTATPKGQELFEAAMARFQVPQAKRGVPVLVMGETILISDAEITPNLAKVIESCRSAGGVGLPDIPGLKEDLTRTESRSAAPNASSEKPNEIEGGDAPHITTGASAAAAMAKHFSLGSRLLRDPVGNTLAMVVLLGMAASFGRFVKALFSKRLNFAAAQQNWTIAILSVIGMGISGYLAYGKMTYAPTLCGPIGNCNAVQQSPHALLFGTIPVALTGVAGYAAIVCAWFVTRYGGRRLAAAAAFSILMMVVVGTIFSMYLTFLEPFVIGATCLWCLGSAAVIATLLWMMVGSVRTGERLPENTCILDGAPRIIHSRSSGEGDVENSERGYTAR